MRKLLFPVTAIALFLSTSCQNAPKADQANASEAVETTDVSSATTMTINVARSSIEWIGSKPIGSHHNGTINITKGGFLTEAGTILGGYFIMNMQSIQPLDQDEKDNAKLKAHLMSADFLDAAKYPEGDFEISSIAPIENTKNLENKDATHTVTGNLTLKGIKKSISFPAVIKQSGDQIIADAHFNLIRTDWNINFNSDASIKDKFINKEINLKIHLEAEKQVAMANNL